MDNVHTLSTHTQSNSSPSEIKDRSVVRSQSPACPHLSIFCPCLHSQYQGLVHICTHANTHTFKLKWIQCRTVPVFVWLLRGKQRLVWIGAHLFLVYQSKIWYCSCKNEISQPVISIALLWHILLHWKAGVNRYIVFWNGALASQVPMYEKGRNCTKDRWQHIVNHQSALFWQ